MEYYLPEKKLDCPVCTVASGSYAAAGDGHGKITYSGFVRCRETFQHQFAGPILFVCPPGSSVDIAAFVNRFEREMHHETVSQFAPTSWNRLLWVSPAPFWLKNSMRKSLFTVLLRAGMRYDAKKDNFKEALYSVKYLSRTKVAVEFFLKGHTWYKGNADGWVNQFGGLRKEEDVAPLLRKKLIPSSALMEFAIGSIGETKETIQAKLAAVPTDEQVLKHALELLKLSKEEMVKRMTKDKSGYKAIMEFALSTLKMTKEELLEKYRKNKGKATPLVTNSASAAPQSS